MASREYSEYDRLFIQLQWKNVGAAVGAAAVPSMWAIDSLTVGTSGGLMLVNSMYSMCPTTWWSIAL